MLRVILSLLVAAILLAAAGGLILYRTVSRSGERAVAAMHADEREYLEDLNRLHRGMTYEEVVSVLGIPTREGGHFRPTWRYRNSPFSQVAVYFDAERASKVRWMSLGRFIYERRL